LRAEIISGVVNTNVDKKLFVEAFGISIDNVVSNLTEEKI
jgi:hypothetical protein